MTQAVNRGQGSRTRLVALVFVLGGIAMACVVVGGIWMLRRTPTPKATPEQTATELAELAQSPEVVELAQSVDQPLAALRFAWLPSSGRTLRPMHVTLRPGHLTLTVSRDGPHYSVRREPEASTTWVFEKSSRNTAKVTLATVVVPADRTVTRGHLIERIYSHLAADLRDAPDDINVHMARVHCALALESPPESRARARVQLVDSITREPNLGALRMALALVDAADKRETGTEELQRWAREKPSFWRLSDLALLHWMRDASDQAIAVAKEALSHAITTDGTHSFNATSRILPIAELAIRRGRHGDAIDLIDRIEKLEPDSSTRKALAFDLRALRAVATFLNGDRAAASALVADGLEEKDPASRAGNEPHRALAVAIRAGNEAGVRAFARPVGSGLASGLFGYYDLLKALGLPSPEAKAL